MKAKADSVFGVAGCSAQLAGLAGANGSTLSMGSGPLAAQAEPSMSIPLLGHPPLQVRADSETERPDCSSRSE